MASRAASATLESLRMGDKTLLGDEPPEWKDYEDPAVQWIQFVLACRSQDPSKVRPFMELARSSKWTMELWRLATEDFEHEELDSDEEAPWCDGCEGPCVCGAEEL